jgi:ABC-2 type transport system permease protein
MFKGLGKLTWLEIKIFVREPLGLVGTIGIPIALFAVFGRMLGRSSPGASEARTVLDTDLPVFGALLISLNAVLSLVTIIAIYREGGILKRLRATPLRPHVILSAHVLVKLLLTIVTLTATILVSARSYPVPDGLPVFRFALALLFVTCSILSIGFLIASLVPTARFAQPIGSLLLYPMVAVSGLFVPVDSLPPALRALSRVLPMTYAVSLLKGIWTGDGWSSHAADVAALVVIGVACTMLSSRVFRWT